MKVRSIHPFPARMAPDLALAPLGNLAANSVVLDPMMGSGTVVRQALAAGHAAIGYDLDPLAVLMTRVWTTDVDDQDIDAILGEVLGRVADAGDSVPSLAWHGDEETARFISYWFDGPQSRDLARVASAIEETAKSRPTPSYAAALDVLRVALSRIVITKEQGASLARDTSHSRPHRVATASDYEVVPNFRRSVAQLRRRLLDQPPGGKACVDRGDARALRLPDASVDAVITSPPYLNAIDYMRGHRMSLVWLGFSIPALRTVRSVSIGAERCADFRDPRADIRTITNGMRGEDPLSPRLEGIIDRYAKDLVSMVAEVARVLKPAKDATFVIGNSCIKGRFIDNARGLALAAQTVGLDVVDSRERDLPAASRYLPVSGDSLSKRMRTETVLACRKLH